ncbi:uncharacterized protein TNCV_1825101 [Trichonephila clavipes]|nr:uncharacterized protein TNCV_1825101 [Trichonephila clavipes]
MCKLSFNENLPLLCEEASKTILSSLEDLSRRITAPWETVAVEQGQEIPQKARETLCSTPLAKAPKIRKSKRKPNASVKIAEALAEATNARKVAMERDYEQIAQFREEEHRATMTYKKRTHFKDEGLKGKIGAL